MAFDECLLATAAHRVLPILRVYRWEPSWVSLGYFQSWAEAESTLPPGVEAVRRLTGGGMVDHRRDQTYSLMIPRSETITAQLIARSYTLIHQAIAEAVRNQGLSTEVVSHPGTSSGGGWCFADSPVTGDIVSGGRKIAGAAQRRTRYGLLHQGSLQLDFPIDWRQAAQGLGDTLIPFQPSTKEEQSSEQLVQEKYGQLQWLHLR